MMSTDSPNTQTAMQLKFILPNTGLKLMYVCANCVFCAVAHQAYYTIMVCFCLFISSYLTMFEKLKQKSRRSLSGSFISPYSDALCQKSNLPSNQDSSSLIGTRTCSMLSRSRIVTDWSVSESKSYVMQNGVPISSCLL